MAGTFIVPNTSDALSIDQAEPDAGDFFALGNGLNAVIDGLVVTAQAVAAAAVDITAGTVLLNNVPVSLDASSPAIAAGGSDDRFDVIVVNDLGEIEVIKGAESAAPRFPSALWTRDVPPVLVGAIYRPAGAAT